MLYGYNGPEIPISWFGRGVACTVTHFEIEKMGEERGRTIAYGKISIMDYIENCPGTDRWIAEGFKQRDGSVFWVVRCDDPNPFFTEKDGTPIFTACAGINEKMKETIVLQIVSFITQQERQTTKVD